MKKKHLIILILLISSNFIFAQTQQVVGFVYDIEGGIIKQGRVVCNNGSIASINADGKFVLKGYFTIGAEYKFTIDSKGYQQKKEEPIRINNYGYINIFYLCKIGRDCNTEGVFIIIKDETGNFPGETKVFVNKNDLSINIDEPQSFIEISRNADLVFTFTKEGYQNTTEIVKYNDGDILEVTLKKKCKYEITNNEKLKKSEVALLKDYFILMRSSPKVEGNYMDIQDAHAKIKKKDNIKNQTPLLNYIVDGLWYEYDSGDYKKKYTAAIKETDTYCDRISEQELEILNSLGISSVPELISWLNNKIK